MSAHVRVHMHYGRVLEAIMKLETKLYTREHAKCLCPAGRRGSCPESGQVPGCRCGFPAFGQQALSSEGFAYVGTVGGLFCYPLHSGTWGHVLISNRQLVRVVNSFGKGLSRLAGVASRIALRTSLFEAEGFRSAELHFTGSSTTLGRLWRNY